MKKIIFIAGLLLIVAACKNGQNKEAKIDENAPAAMSEEAMPAETDAEFTVAMDAFRKKDYTAASMYITTAINDLMKEDAPTDVTANDEFNATIANLQSMADEVKSGQVKNEAELQELFANADMMISHEYLLLTKAYAQNASEKTQSTFQKAGDRMERGLQKLQGESKVEATTIRDKIRADLARGDMKVDAIGNAAGQHVLKLTEWLKKHAAKIGIKEPPKKQF